MIALPWYRRRSLRDRFDGVVGGMSKDEVQAVMGPPADRRSKRWPPQVSEDAEAWQLRGDEFVCKEYRGMDVHTELGLVGENHSVWKADDGVVRPFP